MVKQVIEYTGLNFWFFTIAHAMSLDSTGNVDLASFHCTRKVVEVCEAVCQLKGLFYFISWEGSGSFGLTRMFRRLGVCLQTIVGGALRSFV